MTALGGRGLQSEPLSMLALFPVTALRGGGLQSELLSVLAQGLAKGVVGTI